MSIIGNPAPHFGGDAALHGEIIKLDSNDFKGKWVVLFFYPLDFTFVCPTEIVAFDGAYEQFKAANAEIIGCSVDSVHTHLAYLRTPRADAGVGPLKFPLLADLDKSIAAKFDVLRESKALRGVFIIDPDGVVQSATINNLSVGRNVAEVYRTLKGFQHTRENGDTCPANWQDGDAGMGDNLAAVAQTIG